ncbi:glycosyltransferase [Gimesia algae]|uniref:Glycosyl transferase family 2 n=1 Tax=Gimesia algae TaxID=2527971 RepID=A0A517VBX8_9PLAN|nr:glycosyltransferase [Gimesia algae]QDT90489.1 Glycosyl transferase family 2 [Gimesia algae]
MKSDSPPRLTILMPIHRGLKWISSITATIDRSPVDCRIIVSDITLLDNTLDILEQRNQRDRRITFRRKQGAADWRIHVNELLTMVDSDFFSIMPQDDEFIPGYYESLLTALDSNPSAGLAFGVIDKLDLNKNEKSRMPGVPIPLGQKPAWQEAIYLDQHWNLGIPYRGVVRQKWNQPLPMFPYDFADQIWVFGIALQACLIEVPTAIYLKKYHDENTHSTWTPLSGETRQEVLRNEIKTKLASDPAAMHNALQELNQI